MDKGVGDEKYDKNERIDEGKEAECPDGTPTDDMEEGVSERKYGKNGKLMREKRQNSHMALLMLIRRKV